MSLFYYFWERRRHPFQCLLSVWRPAGGDKACLVGLLQRRVQVLCSCLVGLRCGGFGGGGGCYVLLSVPLQRCSLVCCEVVVVVVVVVMVVVQQHLLFLLFLLFLPFQGVAGR